MKLPTMKELRVEYSTRLNNWFTPKMAFEDIAADLLVICKDLKKSLNVSEAKCKKLERQNALLDCQWRKIMSDKGA